MLIFLFYDNGIVLIFSVNYGTRMNMRPYTNRINIRRVRVSAHNKVATAVGRQRSAGSGRC